MTLSSVGRLLTTTEAPPPGVLSSSFNQTLAVKYVKTSPKAYVWRKLLGEERAIWTVQRVFAPFAMLVGVAVQTFALLSVAASL